MTPAEETTPAEAMSPAMGVADKTVKIETTARDVTNTAAMTVMDAANAEKAIAAIEEVATTEAIAAIEEVITTEAIAATEEVITTEVIAAIGEVKATGMTAAFKETVVAVTTTAAEETTATERTAGVAEAIATITHGKGDEVDRDHATVTVILETGAIITPAKVIPGATAWLPWTSSPCSKSSARWLWRTASKRRRKTDRRLSYRAS